MPCHIKWVENRMLEVNGRTCVMGQVEMNRFHDENA